MVSAASIARTRTLCLAIVAAATIYVSRMEKWRLGRLREAAKVNVESGPTQERTGLNAMKTRSNTELLIALRKLVAQVRGVTRELLVKLGEVDARRLYLEEACPRCSRSVPPALVSRRMLPTSGFRRRGSAVDS
ncbi:MAG: hypothetical protein CME06_01590, partial [Gemmatimonadetes bacterium]|nr:hypothetical protein [Gemmatimonadota bacterium]